MLSPCVLAPSIRNLCLIHRKRFVVNPIRTSHRRTYHGKRINANVRRYKNKLVSVTKRKIHGDSRANEHRRIARNSLQTRMRILIVISFLVFSKTDYVLFAYV